MISRTILSDLRPQHKLASTQFLFQNKGGKVNSSLIVLSKSANMPNVDNNDITKTMLNYSNLHLNTTGTTTFVDNTSRASRD